MPLSLASSLDEPTLAPADCPPPDSSAATGRTLIARQELDDLLANPGQVGPELHQHLGGDALALADEPEQDVLGADVVVAELQRFTQRQLQHLLRPRGEWDVAGRRRTALADDLFDLAADSLERDAEAFERLGRDALALVNQAEQDVLGTDVGVVEQASFLLREDDDPPGSVSEPFEHVRPFQMPRQAGGDDASLYRPVDLARTGDRSVDSAREPSVADASGSSGDDDGAMGGPYDPSGRRFDHRARSRHGVGPRPPTAERRGHARRRPRPSVGSRARRRVQDRQRAYSSMTAGSGGQRETPSSVVAAAHRGQRGDERGPRPNATSAPGAGTRAAATRRPPRAIRSAPGRRPGAGRLTGWASSVGSNERELAVQAALRPRSTARRRRRPRSRSPGRARARRPVGGPGRHRRDRSAMAEPSACGVQPTPMPSSTVRPTPGGDRPTPPSWPTCMALAAAAVLVAIARGRCRAPETPVPDGAARSRRRGRRPHPTASSVRGTPRAGIGPPGHGLRRLTGMWVCSVSHSDS